MRLSQPLISSVGLNSNGDNVTSKETSSGETGSTKEENVILNSDSVPYDFDIDCILLWIFSIQRDILSKTYFGGVFVSGSFGLV